MKEGDKIRLREEIKTHHKTYKAGDYVIIDAFDSMRFTIKGVIGVFQRAVLEEPRNIIIKE